MSAPDIDRAKLRAMMRRMPDEHVYYLLDRAIDELSPEQLVGIVAPFINVDSLRSTDVERYPSLLERTKEFHRASISGEYYESFFVDGGNFMSESSGTRAWIAECHRLLDCAIAEVANTQDTREAIELVFDLLRRIDTCEENIIFFGDEHGSWQVGVHWHRVFPAWFTCLSQSAQPDEFSKLVLDAIIELDGEHDLDTHLDVARAIANDEQRFALDTLRASRERRNRLQRVERRPAPK